MPDFARIYAWEYENGRTEMAKARRLGLRQEVGSL